MMPLDIVECAVWHRETLLREAAADRLARQAPVSRRAGRIGLAAALRRVASRLDGHLRPVAEQPTVAAR